MAAADVQCGAAAEERPPPQLLCAADCAAALWAVAASYLCAAVVMRQLHIHRKHVKHIHRPAACGWVV